MSSAGHALARSDNPSYNAISYAKDMRDTATMAALGVKGKLPRDLRVKILESTNYGIPDRVMQSIEFFKDNFGESAFEQFIWALSTPEHINTGTRYAEPLHAYQSWLFEITDQFIKLLQLTPNLPPILDPLQEIIKNFIPEINNPPEINVDDPYPFPRRPSYSDNVFREKCNTIIESFMTILVQYGLDYTSVVFTQIQQFLKNVVDILIRFLNMNAEQIIERFIPKPRDTTNGLLDTRISIHSTFKVIMLPIFKMLFNFNEVNHSLFKNINLNDWMKYGKVEKAFYIAKLKQENPKKYREWRNDDDSWDFELMQNALERDELKENKKAAKAEAQGDVSEGGRKKKTHSNRSNKKRSNKKRHTCKKCVYKKRSYKKKM